MNEEAFARIVPQLRCCAIKAGRRVGATETEAEDIAQDVMLRLWQMRNDLGRFVSLEGLVARMAHNLTLNLRRAGNAKTIGNSETACIADVQLSPSDVLEAKENLEWLERRINDLPTTEYTILYMRQVEQRSNEEISHLLGIASTSVSTLLARARRRLLEDIKRRKGR